MINMLNIAGGTDAHVSKRQTRSTSALATPTHHPMRDSAAAASRTPIIARCSKT